MHPLTSHKIFVPVYEAYTARAFGSVEEGRAVKPVVVDDWVSEWPKGKEVVLMQSREDTLVPYSQLEIMRAKLEGQVEVVEMHAGLDQNELCSRGERLAEISWKSCRGCRSLH